MRSYLENRLSMLMTVLTACRKASSVISTIPALYANYLILEDLVKRIEDMVQNQIRNIEAVTVVKAEAKKVLIEMVMMASGMLRAYARNNNNTLLGEEVKTSRSSLNHMRDELVYDASKIIIDAITDVSAQMGPYGLTPALLTEMQTALDNYHSKVETPTEARTNRKYYTRELNNLIHEAMKWLRDSIDGNIEVLKPTHPEIVGKYKNARRIYDYSSGRRKEILEENLPAFLSGTVTDSDGLPVSDVLVRIEGTTINTTTDPDGEYLLEVPAGKYNIVLELEGYAEARENDFKVVNGDDLVKDFTIELKV